MHLAAKFNSNRQVFVPGPGENENSSNKDPKLDKVSDIIRCEYNDDGCNTLSPEKYTPMLVAAHYGHKAFIEYIMKIDNKANDYVTETTKDKRRMNILHICAERSASKTDDKGEDDKDKKTKDDSR